MKSVSVVATADTHGRFPEVPSCDLFILAGDFSRNHPSEPSPDQEPQSRTEGQWVEYISHHSDKAIDWQIKWVKEKFTPWWESIDAKEKILVAGNHDIFAETEKGEALLRGLSGHYLRDETIKLFGLKIHGSPWTPEFCGWGFMEQDWELVKYFNKIPYDVDVLITHGPPFGKLDLTWEEHVGSESLAQRLLQIDVPKAHLFGHVHHAYGLSGGMYGQPIVANVAHGYHGENPLVEFDLDIE